MHKVLIAAAVCLIFAFAGASALIFSLAKRLPDDNINICDGKEHAIGDIVLKVDDCRVIGRDLTLKVTIKNNSKGSVFCPTKRIDVRDDFGNAIHINDRPALAIVPGDSEVATYSGLVMSEAASKFTVAMQVCVSQNSDGKQFTREVTGKFNR